MVSTSCSKRIELEEVYLLGKSHERGSLHVHAVEAIADPLKVFRGEDRRKRTFRQYMGGRPRDFVGTTHAVLDLISARLVSLLRQGSVTGWDVYDVEVVSKRGTPIEDYYGLIVTGICGPIDNSKSPRVWREPAIPGGRPYQAWLGFYADLSSWDGSEIFAPVSTTLVFVTERVKTLFEQHNATNTRFQRITEVERLVL